MFRLLPAFVLLSLLLLTPVSNGGSVVPGDPPAPAFQSMTYHGIRLNIPGCNCKVKNLSAPGGDFIVTPSGREWPFIIQHGEKLIYGRITLDSATTTGKLTFTEILYRQSEDRNQQYPGTPATFDVTVTRTGKSITIKQEGGCSPARQDLFCFRGRA